MWRSSHSNSTTFELRTFSADSKFVEFFSCTRHRIQTSGLHDRHHMSAPIGHRNNQLNKCALPNSLKGPKIILDMADHHNSKDGPFRILGSARTFGLTSVSLFFIFYHRHVNVWLKIRIHIRTDFLYEIHIWRMRIFLGFITSLDFGVKGQVHNKQLPPKIGWIQYLCN